MIPKNGRFRVSEKTRIHPDSEHQLCTSIYVYYSHVHMTERRIMSCKKKGRKKKEVDQQAGSDSLDNYAGTASVAFPDPWIRIRPKKCQKTNN